MNWPGYLADFHQRRPGITEAVLARTGAYTWLLEAVPSKAPVLDLACGSAPLWPALAAQEYVGLDASPGELAAAGTRGAGPLVLGRAEALPFGSGSFPVVVCSMSLQILTPLTAVLDEIARVMAPGGLLVALVPGREPLRGADRLWLAGLLAALGRPIRYPNDERLHERLPQVLSGAGLRLADSRQRRFAYRMGSAEDADVLLSSLYLPGLSERRRGVARGWLRLLARGGATMPVPLRRVVAVRG
ncbi:class I SAM-dependent methyltransferase [Streptomyces gobiensis]|uniref:class I SAM-dependent methyltransferase n=1 Tax=Streptomyces gobiensis TaxID=2875706 RepID=UPI001E56891F|nr:class I SAM-dependent methyltransferase [Streptomyces gobiensis]UGY92922.1 class I SAM-dependent methyltransferase [Streptomyces gobiensis]